MEFGLSAKPKVADAWEFEFAMLLSVSKLNLSSPRKWENFVDMQHGLT